MTKKMTKDHELLFEAVKADNFAEVQRLLTRVVTEFDRDNDL